MVVERYYLILFSFHNFFFFIYIFFSTIFRYAYGKHEKKMYFFFLFLPKNDTYFVKVPMRIKCTTNGLEIIVGSKNGSEV